MKSTYAAPAVVESGRVVRETKSGKPQILTEVGLTKRPPSGANLSFGL